MIDVWERIYIFFTSEELINARPDEKESLLYLREKQLKKICKRIFLATRITSKGF